MKLNVTSVIVPFFPPESGTLVNLGTTNVYIDTTTTVSSGNSIPLAPLGGMKLDGSQKYYLASDIGNVNEVYFLTGMDQYLPSQIQVNDILAGSVSVSGISSTVATAGSARLGGTVAGVGAGVRVTKQITLLPTDRSIVVGVGSGHTDAIVDVTGNQSGINYSGNYLSTDVSQAPGQFPAYGEIDSSVTVGITAHGGAQNTGYVVVLPDEPEISRQLVPLQVENVTGNLLGVDHSSVSVVDGNYNITPTPLQIVPLVAGKSIIVGHVSFLNNGGAVCEVILGSTATPNPFFRTNVAAGTSFNDSINFKLPGSTALYLQLSAAQSILFDVCYSAQ